MTTKAAHIDDALAHGWDDDDLDELEKAIANLAKNSLEEVVAN